MTILKKSTLVTKHKTIVMNKKTKKSFHFPQYDFMPVRIRHDYRNSWNMPTILRLFLLLQFGTCVCDIIFWVHGG